MRKGSSLATHGHPNADSNESSDDLPDPNFVDNDITADDYGEAATTRNASEIGIPATGNCTMLNKDVVNLETHPEAMVADNTETGNTMEILNGNPNDEIIVTTAPFNTKKEFADLDTGARSSRR